MITASLILSALTILFAGIAIGINIHTMRSLRRTETKLAATEELNAETQKILDEIEGT